MTCQECGQEYAIAGEGPDAEITCGCSTWSTDRMLRGELEELLSPGEYDDLSTRLNKLLRGD